MLNGVEFSHRLRRILAVSREEAARLDHEYVGTEHLLLALLREGDGAAAAVLSGLDVAPEQIRQKIEETVSHGRSGRVGPDLPYTSRTKRVLELTMEEAMRTPTATADVEHLLIGLCAEEKGLGAQVLAWAGLSTDRARTQLQQ
jgi:ATP-dependent Clp protease ATP-binding subunit ClpC